jgi:hypothetical protein
MSISAAKKLTNCDIDFTPEEAKMFVIQTKWNKALEQLKGYINDPKFADLDKKGSLRKWIIIFSTHRVLVNQEITDIENAKMELQDFKWWF